MTEATLISILLSAVAGLMGVLVVVLGWVGNKMYTRMGEISKDIRSIETTLHQRVSSLDRRVTWIESQFTPLKGVLGRR